jgi:hypothetical protein
MIRFGKEVSDLMQAAELLRRSIYELLLAVQKGDNERALVCFTLLQKTLKSTNDQMSQLKRLYELAKFDDGKSA